MTPGSLEEALLSPPHRRPSLLDMGHAKVVPASVVQMELEPEEKQTNWKAIVAAASVMFLTFLCSNIVGIGQYPYMKQLDPLATTAFFGFATSGCRFGKVIIIMVFSVWSHYSKTSRTPLLVSKVVGILGCAMYLCIEFPPAQKRYLLTICYLLLEIGAGIMPIIRNYLAMNSSERDRSKAFALFHFSIAIGVVLGPVIQLSFSGIAYPGYRLRDGVNLHVYSAPILMALVLNVACLFIIAYLIEDPKPIPTKLKRVNSSISMSSLRKKWASMARMEFSWPLVGVMLIEKATSSLAFTAALSVIAPMMMVHYSLTGTEVVRIMSFVQMTAGTLSLVLTLLFIFAKLGQMLSSRLLFLIAFSFVLVLFGASYPWPMWSHPLPAYNSSLLTGCSAEEYTWCDTAKTSSMWTFVPVFAVVLGIGAPSMGISLDSIYSKVLGNVDQSLMQSLIVMAEDIAGIVGSTYATTLFTASGVGVLWIVNSGIVIASVVLWCVVWRHLGEYK